MLTLYTAFILIPFYWTFTLMFKPADDYVATPPRFFPSEWTLAHFGPIGQLDGWSAFRNSLIVTLISTTVAVTVGFLAGYSLARFNTGGRPVSLWMILQRLLPPVIFLIPTFIILRNLGLVDTLPGISILYTAGGITFSTWIIRSYFLLLPLDFEEAATVDGATKFQLLRHVVLPMGRPAIIAAAAFAFVLGWTEYLLASVLTRSNRTLPVVIGSFISNQAQLLGELAVMVMLSAIPAIILGTLFYRYAVAGLTMGGVKG